MDAPQKGNPSTVDAATGAEVKGSAPSKADDTSTSAQCARLLERLRKGPCTTFEAMRSLDVYHAPARVLQLRKHGHEITTIWERVRTEAGVVHRVGKYVLIKEVA